MQGGLERLSIVTLLVVITISFSPTMTAAVTTETGARGRLSETVLTVVVLADLVILVLFSFAMLFARVAVGATTSDGVSLLARFTWEIGGAVAFGVFVGAMFALYLRYVGREVALVVIAVCALLSQVGSTQQFEPLLAAVAAGLVIENLSLAQGETLKTAVQGAALPVLVIFFVAVGTSLRLDVLAESGVVVIALSALRLLFIRLGVALGVRSSGIDPTVGSYIWTGLVSQAGITLGFAALVASEFADWGPRIQALLVAFIAVHELFGPLLFRYGLSRSGDLNPPPRRPLVVVSNREPYLHRQDERGRIVAAPATGGVAVALDALMRERNGVWVAHGAGPADRAVVDKSDRVLVPPEKPVVRVASAVARRAHLLCVLQRLRERGTLAAVPPGRCPSAVPHRRLGRVSRHQHSLCGGGERGSRELRHAHFHSGLSPRSRGSRLAHTPAAGAHGAVLAHSVALSRSLPHLSVGAGNPEGPAGE